MRLMKSQAHRVTLRSYRAKLRLRKKRRSCFAQLSVVPATPVQAGAPVTLNWEVTDSDHWQLYDYDTDTRLYDSVTGSPPDADSYGPILPQQNTNYELIAFHGQLFTISYAEAMVMAAHFIAEPTATPSVINPGQSSVLSWKTKYASQLTISAGDFQSVVLEAPAGQYDNFPQAPNNQWTVSPTETTNFSLAITGPGGSTDRRYVPVSVNVPPPVINSFTATPTHYAPGQSVTLQWETSDSSSATLSQKNLATGEIISLGSVPDVETSFPVTPPSSTVIYVLSVLGQGGEATGGVLVTESPITVTLIDPPGALIFDGTNLWVATRSYLLKIRPSDGAVLGQYTLVNGVSEPFTMLFDGANIWISSQDDNSPVGVVVKIRPRDGKVLGQYPMTVYTQGITFDGENIWVVYSNDTTGNTGLIKLRASDGVVLGNYSPIQGTAVAFDGENIWSGFNGLTKVLASDGSVLGVYAPAIIPWDVIFDGTHIWVSNTVNNTVSKLRPSDGIVLGTFPTGRVPYRLLAHAGYIWVVNRQDNTVSVLDANTGALQVTIPVGKSPTSLAFDGTHFWVANSSDNWTLMKL